MTTTISDLKAQLGTGMGLRKNKYMIELPYGNIDGSKFNILCKSASFPQREVDVQTVWHHGRKYNVRAEHNFSGDWQVTIYDDSKFTFRRFFDDWLSYIDDTSKFYQIAGEQESSQSGSSLQNPFSHITNAVETVQNTISGVKSLFSGNNLSNFVTDSITGMSGETVDYQTLINIWQLDAVGNKVYGYQLQNAFPKSLGEITYDDSEQDSIVEYTVNFAYSEFIPLQNGGTNTQRISNAIIGDTLTNLLI